MTEEKFRIQKRESFLKFRNKLDGSHAFSLHCQIILDSNSKEDYLNYEFRGGLNSNERSEFYDIIKNLSIEKVLPINKKESTLREFMEMKNNFILQHIKPIRKDALNMKEKDFVEKYKKIRACSGNFFEEEDLIYFHHVIKTEKEDQLVYCVIWKDISNDFLSWVDKIFVISESKFWKELGDFGFTDLERAQIYEDLKKFQIY